jgi:hypothetical protein
MAKFTPSRPQAEVMDTLAHVFIASSLSANVEGMGNFFDYYVQNALTPKQRAIWEEFQQRTRQGRMDIVRLMEEKGWDKSCPPSPK